MVRPPGFLIVSPDGLSGRLSTMCQLHDYSYTGSPLYRGNRENRKFPVRENSGNFVKTQDILPKQRKSCVLKY